VDRRHPSGVRHETADGKDTDARVQRLTLVASRLFDRGAFDAAFESLMKAYLLDPGNPLVVACEKQMMPVWNTLRKTGFPGFAPEEFLAQRKPAPQVRPASPPPQTQAKPDPSSRLEERKRQLEQQRKEREQTMWRNASQPPKSMAPPPANGQEAAPRRRATPRLRDLDKYDRPGLLRWLKGE
jgi:hypothetical protein